MDYDATDIASTYDLGRDHGPEFLDLWMDVVVSQVSDRTIKTILDLGCGTGRFTEALRARFDADVIGIDPSKKMLEQARSKQPDGRIRYEAGRAESIPLPDKSVDLIFISMIFHHLDNPALAAQECRRVLRDDGTLLVRTGIRERISSYPYVDFFPNSQPILEEVLPTTTFVREVFEAAAFRLVTFELITQEISPSYSAYAEKLAAGADSVLARLSQADFDAGMQALRAHAAHSDGQAVFEPIDVFIFGSP
ncbi:MAG TPA: methyltransferase domain-containing protein [Pyrinomonadaceae bacterium]|nr:methyltransferase domain-containing protein [Pyrinomonadaceae bacterium]